MDRRPGRLGAAPPRKPSLSERRELRAAVEDLGEIVDAAARFLEARPRSVAEVRRRLASAGYRTDLVQAAIERLVELGYLDDEAFARAWVESRDRAKPRGEHALRRELGLKGVDRSSVELVLAERRDARLEEAASPNGEPAGPSEAAASPDDAAAERLLRRKLPAILRETDQRRRRQRAYALLARNGFPPDVCSAIVRQVLDAPDTPDGDDG